MKLVLCLVQERPLQRLLWPGDRVIAVGENTRTDERYEDMVITRPAGRWIRAHKTYRRWFDHYIQPRFQISSSPTG